MKSFIVLIYLYQFKMCQKRTLKQTNHLTQEAINVFPTPYCVLYLMLKADHYFQFCVSYVYICVCVCVCVCVYNVLLCQYMCLYTYYYLFTLKFKIIGIILFAFLQLTLSIQHFSLGSNAQSFVPQLHSVTRCWLPWEDCDLGQRGFLKLKLTLNESGFI